MNWFEDDVHDVILH